MSDSPNVTDTSNTDDSKVLQYPAISPYLIVKGATEALAFYCEVLGATERMRLVGPEGMIMHAEIEVGGSVVMLTDEFPDMGFVGPKTVGGTPVTMMVFVDNSDAVYEKAMAAGSTSMQEPADQFYGDRSARIEDPFGHIWTFSHRIEELTTAEIKVRMAQMFAEES